jgi:hypothetical protein
MSAHEPETERFWQTHRVPTFVRAYGLGLFSGLMAGSVLVGLWLWSSAIAALLVAAAGFYLDYTLNEGVA